MTDETIPSEASSGRPTELLPWGQLIRLSLYWLGLSAIFGGLGPINQGRLVYVGIGNADQVGTNLALIGVVGTIIAIIVQPTAGTISDYTMTRWGRRKPYIFIGSILDVVFLVRPGDLEHDPLHRRLPGPPPVQLELRPGPVPGVCAGPVPAPQVGTASALVGLMQILGNIPGASWPRSPWRRRLLRRDHGPRGHRARDHAQRRHPGRRGPHRQTTRGEALAGHRPRGLGDRHPQGAELHLARRLAAVRPHGAGR